MVVIVSVAGLAVIVLTSVAVALGESAVTVSTTVVPPVVDAEFELPSTLTTE